MTTPISLNFEAITDLAVLQSGLQEVVNLSDADRESLETAQDVSTLIATTQANPFHDDWALKAELLQLAQENPRIEAVLRQALALQPNSTTQQVQRFGDASNIIARLKKDPNSPMQPAAFAGEQRVSSPSTTQPQKMAASWFPWRSPFQKQPTYTVIRDIAHRDQGKLSLVVDKEGRQFIAKETSKDGEIKALRILLGAHHPNIVGIHEIIERKGKPHLVIMENLEGETFLHYLRHRDPMNVEETKALAKQLLSALDALHVKGIGHRDIHPENILVVEGTDKKPVFKLIDFGQATVLAIEEPIFEDTEMLGLLLLKPMLSMHDYWTSSLNEILQKIKEKSPQLRESIDMMLHRDFEIRQQGLAKLREWIGSSP